MVCNRGKEGYGGDGKPAHIWAKETIEELSKYTDRKFIIRIHKANSNDKTGDVKDFAVTYSVELDGTTGVDDYSLSMDFGDAGVLRFDGHGGSSVHVHM